MTPTVQDEILSLENLASCMEYQCRHSFCFITFTTSDISSTHTKSTYKKPPKGGYIFKRHLFNPLISRFLLVFHHFDKLLL